MERNACAPAAARAFTTSRSGPSSARNARFSFEPEALYKQRRPRQPEPVAAQPVAAEAEDEEAEDEDEDERGSRGRSSRPFADEAPLIVAATGEDEEEEVAEETEAEGAGMTVVEGEDAAIEEIEVEDDDEEEDDGLLEEVEEDEDDVSGIIDADIEKDEALDVRTIARRPTPGLASGP